MSNDHYKPAKARLRSLRQAGNDRLLFASEFRCLPNPQKSAATWVRNHPIDCVLWATEETKTREDDGEEDSAETDEEQSFFKDRILQD